MTVTRKSLAQYLVQTLEHNSMDRQTLTVLEKTNSRTSQNRIQACEVLLGGDQHITSANATSQYQSLSSERLNWRVASTDLRFCNDGVRKLETWRQTTINPQIGTGYVS